ncbi:LytTR family transcriptional regulator [Marinilabiliaceae bacterium JC017]|nr:LytTR family transcriptional regulator [Marinilabiliaceae bacterium JC017]
MKILNLEKQPKVALKTPNSIRVVELSDVLYVKANNNYVVVRLDNGVEILMTDTLKRMEADLNEYGFVRCHKSYLVNIFCLQEIKGNKIPSVIVSHDLVLPASKEGIKRIKDAFELLATPL